MIVAELPTSDGLHVRVAVPLGVPVGALRRGASGSRSRGRGGGPAGRPGPRSPGSSRRRSCAGVRRPPHPVARPGGPERGAHLGGDVHERVGGRVRDLERERGASPHVLQPLAEPGEAREVVHVGLEARDDDLRRRRPAGRAGRPPARSARGEGLVLGERRREPLGEPASRAAPRRRARAASAPPVRAADRPARGPASRGSRRAPRWASTPRAAARGTRAPRRSRRGLAGDVTSTKPTSGRARSAWTSAAAHP